VGSDETSNEVLVADFFVSVEAIVNDLESA
jgi:hypothetical protein